MRERKRLTEERERGREEVKEEKLKLYPQFSRHVMIDVKKG